jgi:hypothetical protein
MSTQLPDRHVVQQGAHAEEYQHQVSLVKFVFFVEHNISFGTAEWRSMAQWLNHNVGEYKKCWIWTISNKIRFTNADDAIAFKLAWT